MCNTHTRKKEKQANIHINKFDLKDIVRLGSHLYGIDKRCWSVKRNICIEGSDYRFMGRIIEP